MAGNSDGLSLLEFGRIREVHFFLMSFVDLFGVVRSKLVPIAAVDRMEKEGAGFAGYAAHFDMTPADPDVFAFPDISSVIQLPWKKEVAWVACDLYMHGKPVRQAPRKVLKEQIEKASRKGYRMKTGVECEFFLLSGRNSKDSWCNVADAEDYVSKPCYEQGALMRRFDIVSEIFGYMDALGWKPYQADHEDGNGQFEMNWEYDDCLATADRHVFFKFMVKSVAEKYGFRATFMPKPFVNKTGNGAHCHVSLWDGTGKHNLFLDRSGELGLSGLAYEFMGGVLKNAKALCGILNPVVNSYKRIGGVSTASGSSWAPLSVSYSGNNRTHMLRIPDEGRFELRLPDGAVNPYLMQAAILACGLHGIEKKLDPGPRCDWNGHQTPPEGKKLEMLPNNLLDATRELAKSVELMEGLGADIIEAYVKLQMQQWESYMGHLSHWEVENTLDC